MGVLRNHHSVLIQFLCFDFMLFWFLLYNYQIILFLIWFDLFDLIHLHPINSLSVMKGLVFLAWTSTKLGFMHLAQGHNTVTPVRLKPVAPRSQVKHSTTEPLLSHSIFDWLFLCHYFLKSSPYGTTFPSVTTWWKVQNSKILNFWNSKLEIGSMPTK